MSARRTPLRGLALLPLALLPLALALPAEARPPHPRHGRSPSEAIERHAERLGLDAETRAAIAAIAREADARRDALEAERRQARKALRALLASEAPSEAAVLEQAEALGALETEAHKNRLRAMVRIRALLTPDQRAELVRIREELPHQRGGRWRRCHDDLARHCPAARGADALRCLAAHWNEVDARCRGSLEGLTAHPEARAD